MRRVASRAVATVRVGEAPPHAVAEVAQAAASLGLPAAGVSPSPISPFIFVTTLRCADCCWCLCRSRGHDAPV